MDPLPEASTPFLLQKSCDELIRPHWVEIGGLAGETHYQPSLVLSQGHHVVYRVSTQYPVALLQRDATVVEVDLGGTIAEYQSSAEFVMFKSPPVWRLP